MAGSHRWSARDQRRRGYGQNFLVDQTLIDSFLETLEIEPGDLVVDIGAGIGALTIPIAVRGAEVWAVEPDPIWADQLTERTARAGLQSDVRVIRSTVERLRLPSRPFRVIANPPFGLTTTVLGLLLDDPTRGPSRADLILQREVARKHASTPARALRTAAWAPWWEFELGRPIDRSAFRPQPSVDASVLTVRRRDPALLPVRMAPGFVETLRGAWTGVEDTPPARRRTR